MRSPIQSIFRRQLTAYIFGRLPPIFPARNTVAYRSFASSHSYYNRAPRLEPQDRRLQMTFTCTADDCGHRSTHEFSARAYESGIVLLTCPSCKNRHLIADHIGWFKESTEDGKLKTVEDLLRARGENVQRGKVDSDGVIEYYAADKK